MRYRAKHDLLLAGLEPFKKQFVISGEDAGLHLLLTAKGECHGTGTVGESSGGEK